MGTQVNNEKYWVSTTYREQGGCDLPLTLSLTVPDAQLSHKAGIP